MSTHCLIANIELCGKLVATSLLVTDVVLLVIMLAGMLRIFRRCSGSFELWGFLWKQVGHWRFILA